MNVLVSIHDVTPALAEPVRALWALCRACNVTPALLVVPDWHGQWPLEAHPDFVQWLHACSAEGAEVLLHGERHDEAGLSRGWRDSLRALGRTAREGEFLTLDEAAATTRIARGVSRLRALGLDPVGFVPPAWLARQDTHDAVSRLGLLISEDVRNVHLHAQHRRLPAPALRWSGRTAVRAWGSVLVARWRWRTLQHVPLLRLSLHPQDLSHPATARSVQEETRRWTAVRPAVRYASL